MSEKLFLIDGTALAYRSYFAMINSNLRNAEGIPTGAIYGFANALVNLLESEQPSHLAVAWDTHEPTFRHEMDENYKANRPPQPEDLQIAIPLIKEMVAHFGFHSLEQDGYEADDLIGTIATQAKKENVKVFMVTPDKDFMQLVGRNIYMYKPLNRGDGFDIIDRDGVNKYFGVDPDQVVDVLALIGDTSDNIPGVPGIGKKGAAKIIREHGSLEKAVEAAPSMKSKRAREGLTQNREQAFKSRDMIVINTNVPDTIHWKELQWHGVDSDRLVDYFKRMQFRLLSRKIATAEDGMLGTIKDKLNKEGKLDEFGQGSLFGQVDDTDSRGDDAKSSSASGGRTTGRSGNAGNTGTVGTSGDITDNDGTTGSATHSPRTAMTGDTDARDLHHETTYETYRADAVDYEVVNTKKALKQCIDQLASAKTWSFDTETTSTDPVEAELLGIAFSCKKGKAWYLAVTEFQHDELTAMLGPLFRQTECLKIAHHFKYDYRVLKNYGIDIEGPLFDTMLAAYLLDAGQKMDMDTLARSYLNYDPVSIESLIGAKGKDQKSMRDLPVETVAPYACEDADITYRLYLELTEKIEEHNLRSLANEIEFPLARVLADMESSGIKLDLDLLESFSRELDRDIEEVRKSVFELAGEEFNVNSTQQLGVVLFEKLNIPSRKKTATGKYSTSEQVLSRLAPKYEIAAKILEYRGLSKLKSTYVDALPKLVNEKTGRIHSTFNQHVTVTGRLSSTQPNLQNIPVRTERGRGIRKAFVAEEGYLLLAADYSQIELRIIASISGDEAMIRAFREDEDIHARTAAEIFGVDSIEGVEGEHRRKAKEVNFGIPYGVSAFGLAQRLGVTNKEGRGIINAYFERFPAIRKFIDETIAFARDHGYVETLSGRRRYIPDINSRNQNIRGFAERTAVNMPIQGTAADLIKIAMIEIDRELASRNAGTRMLMQVHDELVFEVPRNELETIPDMVCSIMEKAMELKVPLKAEAGISDNWLDAH